jgi:hypothetical protein
MERAEGKGVSRHAQAEGAAVSGDDCTTDDYAFPRPSAGTTYDDGQHGMSLRDYYAGQALTGLAGSVGMNVETRQTYIAYACYKLADAMLEQRVKS